jgi:hypothetical protein
MKDKDKLEEAKRRGARYDPLLSPSRICLVTHLPTGLTYYGVVEDYSIDDRGGLSAIVRLSDECCEELKLEDNLIDPRYDDDEWGIELLAQGPTEIN